MTAVNTWGVIGRFANVRNGGAVIDTATFNVTIPQSLVHSNVQGDNAKDGGLTKNSDGTLILAGAHVAGEVESRMDAALDAGCDMGLVCNSRSDAERALVHLQSHPRPASPRLAQMRARRWPGADYKASPQWLQAVRALRAAALI